MSSPSLLPSLINRIRVDISTHRLLTNRDVFKVLQVPNIEQMFPSLKPDDKATISNFNYMVTMLPKVMEAHAAISAAKQSSEVELGRAFHGAHELDKHNWLPPPNPSQTATLYPHQIKAAKDIIYHLIIETKRGVALDAAAGDGKTFIYGQVCRWLIDKGFLKGCISPWPILVITKSAQETLVMQTQRVLSKFFGLKLGREVYVMSYDALRSSKGLERMISKVKTHREGELVTEYKWVPFLNPRLLIADEVQAARREESIAHELIVAAAECEDMKFIGSSATLFTRVSEAKAVAVNLGVEISDKWQE